MPFLCLCWVDRVGKMVRFSLEKRLSPILRIDWISSTASHYWCVTLWYNRSWRRRIVIQLSSKSAMILWKWNFINVVFFFTQIRGISCCFQDRNNSSCSMVVETVLVFNFFIPFPSHIVLNFVIPIAWWPDPGFQTHSPTESHSLKLPLQLFRYRFLPSQHPKGGKADLFLHPRLAPTPIVMSSWMNVDKDESPYGVCARKYGYPC